ncbi:peptidoglycan-associated lipoprotein Pal [Geothrix fuzhouensis]|uniref:peptidoglycan-associated lipoprotein Pal n=1 Tax=Geothrix fuzhouensis TaxID=2966451 RepID=UPI0021486E07|nr:peptidoglycan-associated lipoprotein Pal [Geothrix fuzhouensis]
MRPTLILPALATGVVLLCLSACKKPAPAPAPVPVEAPAPAPAPAPVPAPAPAPAPALEQAPAPVQDAAYWNAQDVCRDIHFDFDRSDIRQEDRPLLQATADWMKAHPGFKVQVEGNCDERGTNEYNLALGNRRAAAALHFLAGLGVPESRITTLSYGKEKPVCSESNEGCWRQNRRDHFVVKH